MDYHRIYNRLIERGRTRIIHEYTEIHHIVPKCVGGSDFPDNLVKLTPEEHYVAHQLLVKIYKDNDKLVYAACMMVPDRPNNKLYGWLRRKLSDTASRRASGSNNSQFNKIWICNVDLMQNKMISKQSNIPIGWVKGRYKWLKQNKNILRESEKENKKRKKETYAKEVYNQFLESKCASLRDFCRKGFYNKSVVSLTIMFKKYIPEFQPVQGKNFTARYV